MLKNLILWTLAPGAYFWFDRGTDATIRDTVIRWRNAFDLVNPPESKETQEQLLNTRYFGFFGLCGAIFGYQAPLLIFPVIIGLRATFGDQEYGALDNITAIIGLTLMSYLAALAVPIVFKTMVAQREYRKFSRLRFDERNNYKPKTWIKPGNIDFIMAIPVFVLIVSIWWEPIAMR